MKQDKQYDMMLMITDALREGTELLFLGDREIIRQAFNLGAIEDGPGFLKGVVSRKKADGARLSGAVGIRRGNLKCFPLKRNG